MQLPTGTASHPHLCRPGEHQPENCLKPARVSCAEEAEAASALLLGGGCEDSPALLPPARQLDRLHLSTSLLAGPSLPGRASTARAPTSSRPPQGNLFPPLRYDDILKPLLRTVANGYHRPHAAPHHPGGGHSAAGRLPRRSWGGWCPGVTALGKTSRRTPEAAARGRPAGPY